MSKLVVGVNDLETYCKQNNRLDLLEEWDFEKNGFKSNSICYGAAKKVWWVCSSGHKWETQISVRLKNKCGCPYCSGRRAIKGVSDLESLYPEIAKEWDYAKNENLKPSEVKSGSNKTVWWICSNGHSYSQKICDRTRRNNSCPYCSNHQLLEGFNDLKTWCINNNRKDLLEEWNYEKNGKIKPENISAKNSKKIWWKDKLGHEWESTIGSRTGNRPSGCPYCSKPPRKILVGFNDLETWCINNNRKDIITEWDYSKNTISPKET